MVEKNRSIIVTGASGFIGSHLVKRLLNSNFSVIAITRSVSSIVKQNMDNRIRWCEWSHIDELLDASTVIPVAIVHLATSYGRNSSKYYEIEDANVLKPLRLLELAIKYKIKKFINTDSYFSKPEFNYQYMRPYILTKNSFRKWGEYISCESNVNFINMRLEHVYGSGDSNEKFIPFVLDSIRIKRDCIKCTDCLQSRDLIYVDDVVSAYITVINELDLPLHTEYQVGLGYSIALRTFIDEILAQYPNAITKIKFGDIPQRENEIIESKADIKNLTNLGWKPMFDYKHGIKELIDKLAYS